MANDVFTFHWPVFKSGYRWVRGRVHEGAGPPGEEEWALTEGFFQGDPLGRQYSPLKDFPALFRDFAQLRTDDPDAILAFANRYGKLGISSFMEFASPEKPNSRLVSIIETRQEWRRQILDMSEAVALWDLIRLRDRDGLSRCILWRQGGNGEHWTYDTHHELESGQAPPSGRRRMQFIEPVLDLFKPGDVFMPAMFLVQRWINEHLAEHVSPHLLYDLALGAQVLNVVPHDLAGAMWLQLARAIAGNKEYVACKECGRWIEVSHRQADRRTKRREFCSDACKSKNYRQKKDRAAKEEAAKPVAPKKRRPGK
jgi:hypothetical protein